MNTATLRRDGPYELRGELALLAADGHVALAGERIVLCRCGNSKTKPLCDGTHRRIGFHDDGALRARETPPDAVAEGRLTIRARPDGPLMCTGALEILGTNGRRAVAETAFLCRCGASANKPYCDGTHVKIGFSG